MSGLDAFKGRHADKEPSLSAKMRSRGFYAQRERAGWSSGNVGLRDLMKRRLPTATACLIPI